LDKKDLVLEKMLEYLVSSKELLLRDGSIQPTVFASFEHDGIIILPIVNNEDEDPEDSLTLISKVIIAYDVMEYYVVSESYRLTEKSDEHALEDCLSVSYIGPKDVKRIISLVFKKVNTEVFFGELVELYPSNVEGSIKDLFLLKERVPNLTEADKKYIRLLFPVQSEEEIDKDYILH